MLAVLGTPAVLVLVDVGLSQESLSPRFSLSALLLPTVSASGVELLPTVSASGVELLPTVLASGVELLVWRGRTIATGTAGWTLFGAAVLAMAPLVLYAVYGATLTHSADDTSRDWTFVGFISGVAVLSLLYAVLPAGFLVQV